MNYMAMIQTEMGIYKRIDASSAEEREQWLINLLNQEPIDGRSFGKELRIKLWFDVEDIL